MRRIIQETKRANAEAAINVQMQHLSENTVILTRKSDMY